MTITLGNGKEFEAICADAAVDNLLIIHLQNTTLTEVAESFTEDNLATVKNYEDAELQAMYTGYTNAEYICKDGDLIIVRLARKSLSETVDLLQQELTATKNEVAALTEQLNQLKTEES